VVRRCRAVVGLSNTPNSDAKRPEHPKDDEEKKANEIQSVACTNATIKPYAMVIVHVDASPALTAVMSKGQFEELASLTVAEGEGFC